MSTKEPDKEFPVEPGSREAHKIIGNLLKKKRQSQGITLEQRARQLGMDPAILRRIENGGFVITDDHLT